MIRMSRYRFLQVETSTWELELEAWGTYGSLLAEAFGRYYGQPASIELPETLICPIPFPIILTELDQVRVEIHTPTGQLGFTSHFDRMLLTISEAWGRLTFWWHLPREQDDQDQLVLIQDPEIHQIRTILARARSWAYAQAQAVLDFLAASWPETPEEQVEWILLLGEPGRILGHPERIPPLTIRDGFLDLRDRCPNCPDPQDELPWSKVVQHLQTERHLQAVTGLPRAQIRAIRHGFQVLVS